MTEEYGHIPDAFHLSEKEVEELRKSKKELTEYGKQQLRKLMKEPITAKVSEEDYQKIVEAFDNPQPYPDAMFEEAERREKLNAGFKQNENGEWYRPTLQELTRNERIELAEKEIAYMVMGGQDGREYANSIAFVLQVLDSLKDD